MAEKRVGTIGSWVDLARGLAAFQLKPHHATPFPDYKAGQYIALTREGCRLTTKVKDPDGHVHYEPALTVDGTPRIGPVTHSYSIASAPFETKQNGALEIYVTLEKHADGQLGRFTESLFRGNPHVGDTLGYVDRIVGNFTLDQRAADWGHVVMVGTGTGLAPFVGMMKQVAHEAKAGSASPVKYTLIHANRTAGELGYDDQLQALAAEKIPGFDFAYVRSVSRPAAADSDDPSLCQGRANNLFRALLGMPTREQEVIEEIRVGGGDVASAQTAFDKSTKARLGTSVDFEGLQARMPTARTAVLTCGNPDLMEDIKRICDRANFKFEMEEW